MSETHPEASASFNLVDRPWIECAMVQGDPERLSLREVFERSAEIRRLAGESPAQDYAVLRVLLAVYWRAHAEDELKEDDPEEWWFQRLESPGDFMDPVFEYLGQWYQRFDLLDPKHPFMQVPDLETKGGFLEVRRMIPESESDYFSMRGGEGLEELSLAEAARWLIALQAWDYSGIKPGAVGDPRVTGGRGYPIGTGWAGRTGGVVLHGPTLAETLVLNTDPTSAFGDRREKDLPVWERQTDTAAPRSTEIPEGPCDVLTWQSRRVRLRIEDGRATGVLVTNGDRIEMKNQFEDPMTAYRFSKNQSSKTEDVFMPKPHSPERTLWRGVQPLLAREGVAAPKRGEKPDKLPRTVQWLQAVEHRNPVDLAVGVELVGFVYGTQDAVVLNTVHEELPLQLATLMESGPDIARAIVGAAQSTLDAAVNLGQFAGTLLQAGGGTYAFDPDPTEAVLNDLTTDFKRWLARLRPGQDLTGVRNSWSDLVRQRIEREAAVLARGAGPRAMRGVMDDDGRLVTSATATGRLRAALKKSLPQIQGSTTESTGGTA